MENTISFIYAPYIHYEACDFALQSLRKSYENEEVFMYFDEFREDKSSYQILAQKYNCKFILREEKIFFTNRNDPFEINKKKMIEMCNRLIHACENSNSKWMLIFEDDILIKRKINQFPMGDVGVCRVFFSRPGGGAIFRRESFLKAVKSVDVIDIITNIPDASWAADVVLGNIFLRYGASFEEWQDLAEPSMRDGQDHAIFHGYKELYRK